MPFNALCIPLHEYTSYSPESVPSCSLGEHQFFHNLPALETIDLASTNLTGEKRNLIIDSLTSSEFGYYTGHTLPVSLISWPCCLPRLLGAHSASAVAATKAPHMPGVTAFPEPSSLLRNTGLPLGPPTCSRASQLSDSSWHWQGSETLHHGQRILLSDYWKSWMSPHRGVKLPQTNYGQQRTRGGWGSRKIHFSHSLLSTARSEV